MTRSGEISSGKIFLLTFRRAASRASRRRHGRRATWCRLSDRDRRHRGARLIDTFLLYVISTWERTRLACRVRRPRRTYRPVGGAPAGAAEAAALPSLNRCFFPDVRRAGSSVSRPARQFSRNGVDGQNLVGGITDESDADGNA